MDGVTFCISNGGEAVSDVSRAIVVDEDVPGSIVTNITNMSAYAYEYQLSGGYIPLYGGHRVGICGDFTYNRDGKAIFGKINSVCFRISQNRMLYNRDVFKKMYNKTIYNTCVVSPSGCGKTTFLKNFIMHLDDVRPDIHICIADERGELAVCGLRNASVLSNCNKGKAVEFFVRCMNPGVIVFDELWSEDDFLYVKNAMLSGVSTVFSIHGTDKENLVYHRSFNTLSPYIERCVILSKRFGPGTIESVESI